MATTENKEKRISRRQLKALVATSFDFNLLFILLFTIIFGLIMIYSASSYVALTEYSDQWHFFKSQLEAEILGLVVMIAFIFIPYKFYDWNKAIVLIEYLGAIIFPFLVFPFGVESHNAVRWVKIPGIGLTFQPAEVSKFLMILFMAAWLKDKYKELHKWKYFGITLGLAIIPSVLYYVITDNLSSALIIMGICFVMMFVASRDYKKYILLVGIVLVAALVIIIVVKNSDTSGMGFRLGRISAWLDPESSSDTTAHQTIQALYAIGNGGIFGKGLGQGTQKLSNLPEPQNDMIFAVICEELGLVGAFAVIILYALMIWRIYTIAKNTKNIHGFLLLVGVMAHISIQVILNIAVATNSIPNTGVSLPFISYGGSSAVALMCEMGVVFAVNRTNQIEALS